MPSCKPRVFPWEALLGSVLDLVFPPRCVGCGRVDAWLCADCAVRLTRITGPVCGHCGVPIGGGVLCGRCAAAPLGLDGMRSVLLFEGPLRTAIHRFKYRHARGLGEPLGGFLADYWDEHPLPADVVVPVPLHILRLWRRGYNQAALLAFELGKRAGLPVDEAALRRVRATASQMRLDAADRRRNVQGAFRCCDERFRGQRVLVVDDVCTTGATLEACADALRAQGAETVWALTLARAL